MTIHYICGTIKRPNEYYYYIVVVFIGPLYSAKIMQYYAFYYRASISHFVRVRPSVQYSGLQLYTLISRNWFELIKLFFFLLLLYTVVNMNIIRYKKRKKF